MSLTKSLSLRIACDGESSSGKSTAAKLISKKYKLFCMNSGLLFRYASLLIINNKPKKIIPFLKKKFKKLNYKKISSLNLHSQIVSDHVVNLAKKKEVRKIIRNWQKKKIKKYPRICCEGRDQASNLLKNNPRYDVAFYFTCNLKIASFGLGITSCWFYTDLVGGCYASSVKRVADNLKEYLAVTATLGGEFTVGPVGTGPPGMKLETGHDLLKNIFENVIPTAEEYNVRIALESARTSGLKTPQTALRLVKDLESDYLTVAPDFEAWRIPTKEIPSAHVENPGMEASGPVSIDVFKECLPYSPLIHAKILTIDENEEEPNFPIAEMMSLIKESEREHTLSIEYEGWIPDINPHLDPIIKTEMSIALLKRYLG